MKLLMIALHVENRPLNGVGVLSVTANAKMVISGTPKDVQEKSAGLMAECILLKLGMN